MNKPVAFQVIAIDRQGDGAPRPILSRRLVQKACMEEYLTQLRPGDIIDARVTHLEPFGCFVDVGCGISSLIPIDSISVSRISPSPGPVPCGAGHPGGGAPGGARGEDLPLP